MAIAIVATSAIASSGGSSVTTTGINSTGANAFLVAMAALTAAQAITDSRSSTYTGRTAASGGNVQARVWDALTVTGGTSHTATDTGLLPSIGLITASGVGAWDRDAAGFSDVNTSIQAGSVTPAQNGSLIIAVIGNDNSAKTWSINSGFTLIGNDSYNGVHFGFAWAYLIQTTAAAINPTWSTSAGNCRCSAALSVYSPAALLVPIFERHYRSQRVA